MEFFNRNKEAFYKNEVEAAKRIEDKYNKKVVNTCDNYKYDFKCDDDIKYEVKVEPMSLKTGKFLY